MLTRFKHVLRPLLMNVRRDRQTGHWFHRIGRVKLFLRFREECVREPHRRLWFEGIYFKHYRPSGRDCVVDIGAGLGAEIVALAAEAPDLRYIAVEIQPSVYECLSLTLAQLPAGFVPFGLAIAAQGPVRIEPSRTGIDAAIGEEGRVPVEAIDWPAFVARHGIERVDLLKINAEGSEADLVDHIDLAMVERAIVSVHDFRADRGDGEHFRTRERVEQRLREAGFALTPTGPDWIFADRRDAQAPSA